MGSDESVARKLSTLSASIIADATGGKGVVSPGLIRFSGKGTVAGRGPACFLLRARADAGGAVIAKAEESARLEEAIMARIEAGARIPDAVREALAEAAKAGNKG